MKNKAIAKVAAVATGLAMATSMLSLAPIAHAATLTSSQISSILGLLSSFGADSATLSNVTAALNGTSGSTTTTTSGSCSIDSVVMTIGSTGAFVTCLQQSLIANGYSIPAGATGYFGAQTQAAVAKWQAAAGVSPAVGYFGAISRAAWNLSGGSSTNTTTTNTTNTTNNTTNTTTTTTTTSGVEGSFTLTQSATPANNTNVTTSADTAVFGMQVKATGSAMTIDRQDLQVKVMVSTTEVNPANFITSVSAYDGSTLLKTMPIASADVTKDASNVYYIRMTGLGFQVPAGTTKTLTFKVNTLALSSVDVARVLTVTGYSTQGTRGVDGAGLSSYSDASWTSTFTFGASNNSVLTASASSDTPLAQTIAVDTTNGVKGVTMQLINLKSTIGVSTLTDMRVVVQTNGDSTSVPTALYLYDTTSGASTLLGSAAVSTSTDVSYANVDFSNMSLDIAQDKTKTLTVKADFPSTADGIASTTIAANSTYTLLETSDGTSKAIVISSAVTGNDVHLRVADATTYTLVSTSVASTVSGLANIPSTIIGTIVLKATSVGGALTKPTAGMFDVWFASSTPAKTTNGGTSYAATTGGINITPEVTVTPSATTMTDGSYEITITGTLASTHASFVQTAGTAINGVFMAIDSIDTTMDPTGGSVSNQTWGMDTFYTGSKTLIENS